MEYEMALEYITNTAKFGMRLGLKNISKLLEILGNPQKDLKFIHVAGTNGKGSVCAFISQILIESGYSVGLYTSPHLERFTERIKVNNVEISKVEVGNIIDEISKKIEIMQEQGYESPTEFEIETAMAFCYYRKCGVDFVVLEVGLGGRMDATNVIENSELSIITSISLDHVKILGDTVEQIAYEKAGIIKDGGSVMVYGQGESVEDVIKSVCKEKSAKCKIVNFDKILLKKSNLREQIFDFEDFKNVTIKLTGLHQIKNATLALCAIQFLNNKGVIDIKKDNIIRGLKNAVWNGRIEIVREHPMFIIDGAHNIDGVKSLSEVLKYNFNKKETLLIGVLSDKDVDSMIKLLIPYFKKIIVTSPISERSLDCNLLRNKILKYIDNVIAIEDIETAVEYVLKTSDEDDTIVAAGSLYMIGSVRTILKI